jgi:chemotaxis methyl-accepting protein methylase
VEAEDVIYHKGEEATHAELTEAAKHYMPESVPGNREEFSPMMDKMVHFVWGNLIHDHWTCTKEDVCVVVSKIWNIKLTCRG